MLDRIYRRISLLDNDALAQLDRLIDTTDRLEFHAEAESGRLNRRDFMLVLLMGGLAAAGSGAAALLLNQRHTEAPIPTLVANLSPAPTLQGEPVAGQIPDPPESAPDILIENLNGQLADAQAERLALRAQLDSARAEIDSLSAGLQAAQNDLAYLQQVLDLYQQLEAVRLDDAIAAGMTPVGAALLAIQGGRSLLTLGVEQAAALLATIEAQSPGIANGLLWLEDQVSGLAAALQDLEDALSAIVEPVAPVAQQIGDFIGQVLDLLPFGVGEQIRAGLEAIAAILTHIPELVASINPMILTPLRQWVSPEGEGGLVEEVVRPISANLVNPAQTMVDETASLEAVYNSHLKTPVEQALATRAAIRETIATLTGAAT